MEGKIYPEPVKNKVLPIIKSLEKQRFFIEEEVLETEAYKCFCEFFLPQFISGEEFHITEDQFEKLLIESIIGSHLTVLKQKGLLDSIDDPAIGEEVYFATKEGKELIELINKVEKIKPKPKSKQKPKTKKKNA
jgi:hypothetical protein